MRVLVEYEKDIEDEGKIRTLYSLVMTKEEAEKLMGEIENLDNSNHTPTLEELSETLIEGYQQTNGHRRG